MKLLALVPYLVSVAVGRARKVGGTRMPQVNFRVVCYLLVVAPIGVSILVGATLTPRSRFGS